jgi:hypothetical protein
MPQRLAARDLFPARSCSPPYPAVTIRDWTSAGAVIEWALPIKAQGAMQMLNYEITPDGVVITTTLGVVVAKIEYDASPTVRTPLPRWKVSFVFAASKRDGCFWSLEAAKYYVLALWLDDQAHPSA